MTADSDAFEQKITRIHRLIETGGATVTWDEKIPDPDNPSQMRQVDFTIRRGDLLTIGECRIRQRPQDVMWIEELIGRKISFKADAVIAVSNSGFTEGAVRKAKAHGIFLRDLETLTDQEIAEWGNSVDAEVHYMKIENLRMELVYSGEALGKEACQRIGQQFYQDKNLLPLLLQDIYSKIDTDEYGGTSGQLKADVITRGRKLDGHDIQKVVVAFRYCLSVVKVTAPYIKTYGEPKKSSRERHTTIENISRAGATEVIQNGDRAAMLLDLSSITIPPSSVMLSTGYDFKRLVVCKMETTGEPSSPISLEGMKPSLSLRPAGVHS